MCTVGCCQLIFSFISDISHFIFRLQLYRLRNYVTFVCSLLIPDGESWPWITDLMS
jgi:hypothetical protein